MMSVSIRPAGMHSFSTEPPTVAKPAGNESDPELVCVSLREILMLQARYGDSQLGPWKQSAGEGLDSAPVRSCHSERPPAKHHPGEIFAAGRTTCIVAFLTLSRIF